MLHRKDRFCRRVAVIAPDGTVSRFVHAAHAARMIDEGSATAHERRKKLIGAIRLRERQITVSEKRNVRHSRANLVGTRYTYDQDLVEGETKIGQVLQLRGILEDTRAGLFAPEVAHIYRLSVLDCVPGNPNEKYQRAES